MYQEYEAFMLGAVKRLEKGVHEEAQAVRIARIVDVSTAKRVAASHGPVGVLIAEVIEVEAEGSTLLGEEDFSPLEFFSRSEDNDLGDEVDYDTDSQNGISVESPFSMQLAFSSPLSLDKDFSACMALLRNSLNFAGTGELHESGEKEQEGTTSSHAQDQVGQDQVILQMPNGSDSGASFSALSLPIPAGKEMVEVHPPIRKVGGLTPPRTTKAIAGGTAKAIAEGTTSK